MTNATVIYNYYLPLFSNSTKSIIFFGFFFAFFVAFFSKFLPQVNITHRKVRERKAMHENIMLSADSPHRSALPAPCFQPYVMWPCSSALALAHRFLLIIHHFQYKMNYKYIFLLPFV